MCVRFRKSAVRAATRVPRTVRPQFEDGAADCARVAQLTRELPKRGARTVAFRRAVAIKRLVRTLLSTRVAQKQTGARAARRSRRRMIPMTKLSMILFT